MNLSGPEFSNLEPLLLKLNITPDVIRKFKHAIETMDPVNDRVNCLMIASALLYAEGITKKMEQEPDDSENWDLALNQVRQSILLIASYEKK